MASLIAWLKYSGARKSDGTPVASGRAFFYQPGTTSTQIQVYSDVDGLVGLTQPVALDAAGRATVYAKLVPRIEVQEAVTNTVVGLSDRGHSLNAAQVEVENASYVGTDLVLGTQVLGGRTDLNTVLSTIVAGTYQESGTATPQTLADAIGRWVTPQDYGAIGNGVADDLAAFTLAIARCAGTHKGLWLPPGSYRISAPIAIGDAGLVVRGASRSGCVIVNASTTGNAITVNLLSAIESNIVLENFTITAATVSSGAAISVVNGDGIEIHGVTTAFHRTGFGVVPVSSAYLEDCTVLSTDDNAAGRGFALGVRADALKCRVTSATNGKGFSLEGAFARAMLCRAAVTTGTGFDLAASDTVVTLCAATGTTLGFAVGAYARAGCVLCSSTDAGSADFASASSATSVVEISNTFTTRSQADYGGFFLGTRARVVTRARATTASVVSFSWTPDPRLGELQILVWTGDTVSLTLTINATGTTGLVDGQCLTLVMSNEAGSNFITRSYNAQYVGISNTAISAVHYQADQFVWRAATSKWIRTGGADNVIVTAAAW